LSYDFLSSG
jgi:hypothetical protein